MAWLKIVFAICMFSAAILMLLDTARRADRQEITTNGILVVLVATLSIINLIGWLL